MLAPPGSSEGAKSLHHPLSNGVEVVFGENVKRVAAGSENGSALLSQDCFNSPIVYVNPEHGDHRARLKRQMVPVKPITTCEFISILQRCKPPTGWPSKLGMNTVFFERCD